MTNKIDSLVKMIGEQFKNKNLSLVTAESCTGGALAYAFSKNPEYSSILERGYVTYSNPAKESLLKVSSETIQVHGAISKETAEEMAQGALTNSQAQVSIAITGMAGTDRAHSEKGLVWICCLDNFGHKITKKKNITGSRENFILNTVYEALLILKQNID